VGVLLTGFADTQCVRYDLVMGLHCPVGNFDSAACLIRTPMDQRCQAAIPGSVGAILTTKLLRMNERQKKETVRSG